MPPGLIAGGMMSFITAINELSSTLILYTSSTMTMPVRVYLSVLDGEPAFQQSYWSVQLLRLHSDEGFSF